MRMGVNMISKENSKKLQLAILDQYMDGIIAISGDNTEILISRTASPIREYIEVEVVTKLLRAKVVTILKGVTL
jgi:hypothetical protein